MLEKRGLYWGMNTVLGGGDHWVPTQRLPIDALLVQCAEVGHWYLKSDSRGAQGGNRHP